MSEKFIEKMYIHNTTKTLFLSIEKHLHNFSFVWKEGDQTFPPKLSVKNNNFYYFSIVRACKSNFLLCILCVLLQVKRFQYRLGIETGLFRYLRIWQLNSRVQDHNLTLFVRLWAGDSLNLKSGDAYRSV